MKNRGELIADEVLSLVKEGKSVKEATHIVAKKYNIKQKSAFALYYQNRKEKIKPRIINERKDKINQLLLSLVGSGMNVRQKMDYVGLEVGVSPYTVRMYYTHLKKTKQYRDKMGNNPPPMYWQTITAQQCAEMARRQGHHDMVEAIKIRYNLE